MDSFELNKIFGALLGALLFVMGIGIFSDVVFTPAKMKAPGYALPSAEAAPAAAAGAAAVAAEPLPVLLAKADAKKGEGASKACAACHTFDKGGANKVGPNLYDTVNRDLGTHAGFGYSDAIKGKGGKWSYEALDAFIANPKGYVPGTKMAYAGEKDAGKRADIIAYLRGLSEKPADLPK